MHITFKNILLILQYITLKMYYCCRIKKSWLMYNVLIILYHVQKWGHYFVFIIPTTKYMNT